MKLKQVMIFAVLCICAIIGMTIYIEQSKNCLKQSVYTVDINRQIQDIERSWDDYKNKNNELVDKTTKYDYCVIDSNNLVLEYTDADVANNIQTATSRFDVVRNIEVDDEVVGYLIIKNDLRSRYNNKIDNIALFAACICGAMLIVFIAGFWYINSRMLKPFDKLKKYATRIASGDLDVPLDMDRNHIFGEFTESFDIMREELLKAREIEKKADKSKKELVAQLSHDIKTPVASIKAMTDVLSLGDLNDEERKTIKSIDEKADKIDSLISNLFHATLEELEELNVTVGEVSSKELLSILEESDYLDKVVDENGSSIKEEGISPIKDSIVNVDKLRISQVFSNIITNSYKYAASQIVLKSEYKEGFLLVELTDKGKGVNPDELDSIMEKFSRGTNAKGKDGSGLGLFISKYLMEKMDGSIECENAVDESTGEVAGFRVKLYMKLA